MPRDSESVMRRRPEIFGRFVARFADVVAPALVGHGHPPVLPGLEIEKAATEVGRRGVAAMHLWCPGSRRRLRLLLRPHEPQHERHQTPMRPPRRSTALRARRARSQVRFVAWSKTTCRAHSGPDRADCLAWIHRVVAGMERLTDSAASVDSAQRVCGRVRRRPWWETVRRGVLDVARSPRVERRTCMVVVGSEAQLAAGSARMRASARVKSPCQGQRAGR